MSDRIANLQSWLIGRGAVLVVDGQWGPATRHAVIEVFRNREAPAVEAADIRQLALDLGCTERQIKAVEAADIRQLALDLGCTERQIKAVAKVESAGGGWDDSGLLKCLWERHYLWRRVKVAVPFLSNPTGGGYTIDADRDGINDSWEKLADATGLFGFSVAAECASFGKFQIMGAHWKALGYRSVADFVWQLSRSEAAHYEAFGRFIEANKLTGALRQVSDLSSDCLAFARGYNGKGQKGYDGRIAAAYRSMAG